MPRNVVTPVLYVPDHDVELLEYAHIWNKGRKAKGKPFYVIRHHKDKHNKVLEDVHDHTKIYVVAHGVSTRPWIFTCKGMYTADALAERLYDDGLSPSHVDLRIFACNSGLATHKDQPKLSKKEIQEYGTLPPLQQDQWLQDRGVKLPDDYAHEREQNMPFAMQLAMVLRGPNYRFTQLFVSGYQGYTATSYLPTGNTLSMSAADTHKGVYVPGDKDQTRHRAHDKWKVF